MANTIECKELGVRRIEYNGGNVLIVKWLPEILQLCQNLGIESSVSLSGPLIMKRFSDWGEDWIKDLAQLRFSIDGGQHYHDSCRGEGYYQTIEAGLRVAGKVRKPGTTQLVFTLRPGAKGNINREQFESVLHLAQKHQVEVNANPLFGIEFVGNKSVVDALWQNLTDKERSDLQWLMRQPLVNKESLRKFDFLFEGGNDLENPSCKACRAVLTISTSNRVILPCCHNPELVLPIVTDLKSVLESRDYQENIDKAGTFSFCEKCTVWCNLVPSWALEHKNNVPEWANRLTGI